MLNQRLETDEHERMCVSIAECEYVAVGKYDRA